MRLSERAGIMNETRTLQVRAVYHDGVFKLLDPLDIDEGTRVRLVVLKSEAPEDEAPHKGVYPNKFIPAERLRGLIGLVSIGGDALEDSEALYDSD